MANIRSSYQEIEIPFVKMSWNSDVPSSQLGPNEFNIGQNIETDVRGIKSVLGIEPILQRLPTISATEGLPVYITGGYLTDNNWYYIVGAKYGNVGRFFKIDSTTVTNITPGYSVSAVASIPGWSSIPNITESWNGTALIINDGINPPYYLQGTNTEFKYYSNVADYKVFDITYAANVVTLQLDTFATNVPYVVGDIIQILDAYSDSTTNPLEFNGSYVITNVVNTFTVQFVDPGFNGTYVATTGLARPKYQWNYNPSWYNISAGFCRVFNSPNVGSVLIAGDLGVQLGTDLRCDTNSNVTINVDGSSNYVLSSYIGYNITGTNIPINTTVTGANQTAGTLTISNSATGTTSNVKLTVKKATIDRFPNTVRWSQNFGLNEVPNTWAPTINNVANELEVPCRGPVLDGFPSSGNFYVSSYWDTVVFAPIAYQTTQVPVFGVRLFNNGRGLLSSNCWVNADDKVYGIDARDWWVFDGSNFVGLGNQRVKNYIFENIKAGQAYTNLVFMENNTAKNQVELYFPNTESTTYCNEMISYRYDLDVFNPPWRWTTTDNTSANATPIIGATEGPVFRVDSGNIFDPSTRTVVLITPIASANVDYKPIVQKDQGFSFVNQSNSSISYNITSTMRRDNIQLLKDYSGQLLLHRVLPEINNINEFGREKYYSSSANIANVIINVGGSDSVGEIPTMNGNISFKINTTNPWVQIDQNAYRLNSVEFNHVSNNTAVIINSLTYQYTPTQDAR